MQKLQFEEHSNIILTNTYACLFANLFEVTKIANTLFGFFIKLSSRGTLKTC